MKRFLLLVSMLINFIQVSNSQIYRDTEQKTVLNGVLHQKDSYEPVAGAKIEIKGTNVVVFADNRGFFLIPDIGRGGEVWLQISAEDYETLNMAVNIGGVQELGIIFMETKQRDINPITVNDLRVPGSDVGKQSFSEVGTAALLLGVEDILVKSANYNLGNLGFKLRGYEWKSYDVYFNGVLMNEPEIGYSSPILWNALNDATQKSEGSYGLKSSLLYFGNLNGVSNLRIRPSEFRRQFKASYSFSNGLYSHQLRLSYTTGQMSNGWSILGTVSSCFGNGFIDGSKFKNLSYLFVAEKDFENNHRLMVTVVGSPLERAMQNYSSKKAYNIVKNNSYNSAWGYDDGNKRTSRLRKTHQPLISISHNWDINDWALLRTTFSLSFGKNSETDLQWTSAVKDPRPDTYDKIPTDFQNVDKQQILWKDMYEVNRNYTSAQSQYILGAQHSDKFTISLNSIYDNEIEESLTTTVGMQSYYSKYNYYNKLDDLLGGDYWLDIDKFGDSEGLVPINYKQNDLNHIDRIVKTGDRFGYDYSMSQIYASLWNKWMFDWKGLDIDVSALASYTSYWREGYMKNGKFPNNSEGKSSKQKFINFSLKGGVSYPLFNITNIEGTIIYATRAPLFRDSYIVPQMSDLITNDLKSEKTFGGELNYTISSSYLNVRTSVFYTNLSNQIRTRFYYDNDYNSVFGMTLSNLNQRHYGGELTLSMTLLPELVLNGAVSYGIYKYTSEPNVLLMQHNIASTLVDTVSQIKGLYVSGAPQIAATTGLVFTPSKRWWLGLNVNYTGNNYAEVNPILFTDKSNSILKEHADFAQLIKQEKFKTALTFDFYGGYTFDLKGKYLGINVNIQNILNDKEACIGAYNPLTKLDVSKPVSKYDIRCAYAYGRTVFIILSFRF